MVYYIYLLIYNLIKINDKFKKTVLSKISSEISQKNKRSNLLYDNNYYYSKILPSDLLDNTTTIEEKKNSININNFFNKKKEKKDISQSQSTIDNVNANNDISLSIDLNINKTSHYAKAGNEVYGFIISSMPKTKCDSYEFIDSFLFLV